MEIIKKLTLYDLLRITTGLFGFFIFATAPDKFFFNPPGPYHLPLFDYSFLDSLIVLLFVKITFLVSLISFIAGIKVHISGLIAGLTKLILLFSFTEGVLAFYYLLPFIWICFAVVEFNKKRNITSNDFVFPFVILLATIFIGSALHKAFHYDFMFKRMPIDLMRYFRPAFSEICRAGNCSLMKVMLYTVVPFELLLGILILFKPKSKFAALLNILFCLFLYTIISLRRIGLSLLLIHSAIFISSYKFTFKDFYTKKSALFFGTTSFILLLSILITLSSNPYWLILREFILTFALYSPFLFILISVKHDNESFSNNVFGIGNLGIALLTISFTLFPAIDGYQKSLMLGWSMFSGAYLGNKIIKVNVYHDNCVVLPNYHPIINSHTLSDKKIRLTSFSQDLITRLEKKIIAKCPSARVEKE